MKYKVIGWTYYDNSEILDSGNTIGFAERNAIIDEIKKHGYLFSGWHHQESWDGVVPVLNDGRKRCYSQRGWGGVMAEAYGKMGDYDYASFTFHQSIDSSHLHFAPDDFEIFDYEPQVVENEDFVVEVNEGLFEIAKTSNPFYLDDIDELRFVDKNDTITLSCNGEELFFVVKDIDRDKASNGFKRADELITTTYKIIVTHKPQSERVLSKAPRITCKTKAFELFEQAMHDYDYDVIKEATELFYVEYIAEHLKKRQTKKSLSLFVEQYADTCFDAGNLLRILKYLDNFDLFEKIADKIFDKNKWIYVEFVNHYLEKGKNLDEQIAKFANSIKPNENLYSGSINILLKAICLKPDNKALRKKYYKAIKSTRHEGLAIMAGAGLYRYLRKEDKKLLEPDKYESFSDEETRRFVEYVTFPHPAVKDKTYPYYLPKIYEQNEKVVADCVKAYQQYINERFDVDAMLEKMILCGIDKKCFEMDRYLCGEEHSAKYVHTMDMLTNFKYNFKQQALDKYASQYQNFEQEVEDVYKR